MQRVHIRVTMAKDGRTPVLELVVDQVKVAELSPIDVIEANMQFASSLRWVLDSKR